MFTKKTMIKIFIAIILSFLSFSLPFQAHAIVEHVILITIDGIRNSDGFGDADCQDGAFSPATCLLANIETLLPQTTLYTGQPNSQGSAFVNNLAPWTTPGHTMLLTGVRDIEPNIDGNMDLRPIRPTIFERLRKELGWAKEDLFAVVSKQNVKQLDYSLDPLHGPSFGADGRLILGDRPGAAEDRDVATVGRCVMQGRTVPGSPNNPADCVNNPKDTITKPKLLFLHFGGVDARGHKCNPNTTCIEYTNAISQVDGEIFNKIICEMGPAPLSGCPQGSGTNTEFRFDNTAVFITTDHGRESFSAKDHGGLDFANRAIFLLAGGPGIPPGQIFTNDPFGSTGCRRRSDLAPFPCRQQEDLAPTIASIFGVSMPDSEGVVMNELLGSTPPPFSPQRSEAKVESSQGYLHAVWSERDTYTGERSVFYQRLNPVGVTSLPSIPAPTPQAPPIRISSNNNIDPEGNRITTSQPYIFSILNRLYIVYSVTKSIQQAGDNIADIYLAQGTDGGSTWGTPERVAKSIVETPANLIPKAYLAPATVLEVSADLNTLRRWVFVMQPPKQVLGFYSDNQEAWTSHLPVVIDQAPSGCDSLASIESPLPCLEKGFFAQRSDAAIEGQKIELLWQAAAQDARWDIIRAENSIFSSPGSWTLTQESPTGDTATAYLPSVGLKGNTLNVLWSDNQEVTLPCDPGCRPIWRIRGSRSTSPVSGPQAFMPDVVARSASQVYAVYSRVNPNTGDYDIYKNRSDNGGVFWPNEASLLETPNSPSLSPSITYDQVHQHIWAFWREGISPNWIIKGQIVE